MSLKDYRFPQTKVTDNIVVRGLSMADVTILVKDHIGLIKQVFEQIDLDTVTDNEMKSIVARFTPTMPPLAAAIIALGCGEPENEAIAIHLPLGIQIDAIHAIGELTFSNEGGVRGGFQKVMGVVNSLQTLVTANPTPLKNGSGESEGKFPS